MIWAIAIAWIGMMSLGAYVAAQKERPPVEGLVFAALLGPIGILIEVLLPNGRVREVAAAEEPVEDDSPVLDYLGRITPAPSGAPPLPAWMGKIPSDQDAIANSADAVARLGIKHEPAGLPHELPPELPAIEE